MNNKEKKLVKALIVGGSIATGITLNSTSAMAAEVEDVDADLQENQQDDVMSEKELRQTIQDMEDATEVIEGDATAEEAYLDRAHEVINNDWITEEVSEEILTGSSDIMEQAQAKNDVVKNAYEVIATENEEAKAEFNKQAENNGLAEYAAECEEAEDAQQKVEIIDKTVEIANSEYADFINEHSEELDAYNSVIDDIRATENSLAEKEPEYQKVEAEYADIDSEHIEEMRADLDAHGYQEYRAKNAELDQRMQELGDLYDQYYAEYKNLEESFSFNDRYFELEDMLRDVSGEISDISNQQSDLHWDMFGWDDTVYLMDYEYFVNHYDELGVSRNELGGQVTEIREKLDTLKSNEGYQVISPVKEANEGLNKAASGYRRTVLAEAEAAVVADRAAKVFKQAATSYEEVKNLIYAYDSTNTARNNATVSEMMSDVAGIEAGTNTVEQTLDNAKNLVATDDMNPQLAKEQTDKVAATVEQIQEKNAAVIANYNQIAADTAKAEAEFAEAADKAGLADYATRCADTENGVNKVTIVSDAIVAANKNHDTFVTEHATDLETYNALVGEIEDLEYNVNSTEYRYNYAAENKYIADCNKSRYEYYNGEEYANKIKEYQNQIDAFSAEKDKLEAELNELVAEDNYNERYFSLAGLLSEVEEDIWRIQREMQDEQEQAAWFLESANAENIANDVIQAEADMAELEQEIAGYNARIAEINSSVVYTLVTSERDNYENFISAANNYKEILPVQVEAEVVLKRTENAVERAVAAQTEFNSLIDIYNVVPSDYQDLLGKISETEKKIADAEIKSQETEATYTAYYEEHKDVIDEYYALKEAKENSAEYAEIATINEKIEVANRYIEELKEELHQYDGRPNLTEKEGCVIVPGLQYDIQYEEAYVRDLKYQRYELEQKLAETYKGEFMAQVEADYIPTYVELKDASDAAAEKLARLQDKLEVLNQKKADFPENENKEPETEEPTTEEPASEKTVENTISDEVYTVVSTLRNIVNENADIAEKVYALTKNDKAVSIVKYVYANVNVATVNKLAKQITSMDINAAIVNSYLDKFVNWLNK